MGGDGTTTWPQPADIPAPVGEVFSGISPSERLGLLLEKHQKNLNQ